MNCSKRISLITELLDPCDTLCDVGCDHGYACIMAVSEGKALKAIASDINRGPLNKAQLNISCQGLTEKISTCLSDGLLSVDEPFDALSICGMGGLLIKKIIRESQEKAFRVNQMVLSPQSEYYALREYIYRETPFYIFSETSIKDAGKFYVFFDVRKGNGEKEHITERDLLFGDPALERNPSARRDMLKGMLLEKEHALKNVLDGTVQRSTERALVLKKEIAYLKELTE